MEIVNRVEKSGLIQINLEEIVREVQIIKIDIADILFKGLILKESDLKLFIKEFDWMSLEDKIVLIYCSADAIIPTWAFMRLLAKANAITPYVFAGDENDLNVVKWRLVIDRFLSFNSFEGAKLVIKGCSDLNIPISAYTYLTGRLQNKAKSIMFGEPCSTVPVFKKPKQKL